MFTKVPPDGGWGWMIVIASSLNAVSTIPFLQGFGLIFKDSLPALNLTSTDMAVIINVNLAFGMILGLVNGPLLKTFGYRKIALVGCTLNTIGVTMTSFANSFTSIMITYGILASVGMSMSMSGFSLALNSYFTTKRGRATGLAMTLTGLGPILMPQVASILLSIYDTKGTVLIFGAFSLHSMIGILLLHPIKWHMKSVPLCLETFPENSKSLNNEEDKLKSNTEDETNISSSRLTINASPRKRKLTISSIDHDVEVGSIYGFDAPLLTRQLSIDRSVSYDANYDDETLHNRLKWWNSKISVDSVNLGSCMQIFDEPVPVTKKLTFVTNNGVNKSNDTNQDIVEQTSLLEKEIDNSIRENYDNDQKNTSAIRRILQRLSDLYDFDILRDPIYVNIMLGMSIAIFAEVNFSTLTPFILADMRMTTAQIANVMSIIAIVDLCFRGAAPFLGEWLRQPPRIMYMISLMLLIISRTSLIFANSFVSLVVIAMGLGAAKGIRSVYMVLVVPSYVPIQKLPNASGIQMMTNGIILICAGPILGIIRDNTGSYNICIILMNCVTAVTIIIWTIEMIFMRRKLARQKSELPRTTT